MTYIEFFDQVAVENVCACLTFVPERVIYLGNKRKLMERHIQRYQKVFHARGQHIEFLTKSISQTNLGQAVQVLTELVNTYDDCVFDITGGEELLVLALGMVCAAHPEKKIQIQRFNLRNNVLYDCDMDGNTTYRDTPTLSVEENIRIYGGDVLYGDVTEENTYLWDMTEEFARDIRKIWNICKGDVRYWNMQISILAEVEAAGIVSGDGLTTRASRNDVDRRLARIGAKYKPAAGILDALVKAGLVTFFDDGDEKTVTVSYKNQQVKRCLTKAGQALEMKVFLEAKEVLDDHGEPVYDDVCNGVVIDWDGVFHDETVQTELDTENEIDILLMHDVVPVFISCKNGVVTADELYKLEAVARRFGGPYARKVLVANALKDMKDGGKYLRQRMEDMGIMLIENLQDMDDGQIRKALKSLWNRSN